MVRADALAQQAGIFREHLDPCFINLRAEALRNRRSVGVFNAITDVPGVHVGHATVRSADGQVHTGVTAILPNDQNVFMDRPVDGSFVLNGAGEMSGLIQVQEWGMIETPILLTNTMAVGSVSAAAVRYLLTRYPG